MLTTVIVSLKSPLSTFVLLYFHQDDLTPLNFRLFACHRRLKSSLTTFVPLDIHQNDLSPSIYPFSKPIFCRISLNHKNGVCNDPRE